MCTSWLVELSLPSLSNDLLFFMQDVFDKDVFQNDFMGTVSLTVDEIKEASKVFYLNFESSFAF